MMIADTHGVSGELTWNIGVYYTEMTKCKIRMQQWRQSFEEFLQRKTGAAPTLPATMLKLMHSAATVIIAAGMIGPEMRLDSLQHHFVEILDLAETVVAELYGTDGKPSFSAETGCKSHPVTLLMVMHPLISRLQT